MVKQIVEATRLRSVDAERSAKGDLVPETVLLDDRDSPFRVMMLVSATGANLRTVIQFCDEHPDLIELVLVASDRVEALALEVARAAGVETWAGHFEEACGRRSDCRTHDDVLRYEARATAYHDELCARVENFERARGEIDLVILAYHRWVHGRLLNKFAGRMINQHPGDLSILDGGGHRLLVGLDPVGEALRHGFSATRTSTFLVDDAHDGGAVLVCGPPVHYTGRKPPTRSEVVKHEMLQKVVSDRPALRWTLMALAHRRLAVSESACNQDMSPTVLLDGRAMELGGYRMPAMAAADIEVLR